MIAYVMLYAVAVAVPVLLASWAVAALLRRYGRPERMVWLTGTVLAFALPVLGLLGGRAADVVGAGAQASSGSGTGVIGLPEIFVVSEGAGGASLTELLVALWIGASALLALRLVLAAVGLARMARSWRPSTMDGVQVWLTDRVGPAVSGLVRPRVLVPTWLADMPAHRRSLVLLHEQEHIRARDPWMMLVSRLAPIVAPWHPVVWIMSARLLRAIELDCDRRVLRHRPDVRAYGHTLIEISSRDSGRLVAVAAFAESEAPLRSRILNMTTPSRTVSIVALLTSMVLGVVLMIAAFEIPVPTIRAELSIGPDASLPTALDREVADATAARGRDAEQPVDAAEEVERLRAEPLPTGREAIERQRGGTTPPERLDAEEGLRREGERALEAAREAGRLRREAEPPLGTDGPSGSDVLNGPVFTPFTVAPVLINLQEVQRALVREYPTVLRDSGIGGRVLIWFFIDEEGLVRQTQINQSSGYPALDQAALNVASVYRFSPALNRENRVAVWVALPLTFQVR